MAQADSVHSTPPENTSALPFNDPKPQGASRMRDRSTAEKRSRRSVIAAPAGATAAVAIPATAIAATSDAAVEVAETLTAQRGELEYKIGKVPARTIDGLKVRATVLKFIYGTDKADGRPDCDYPEGLNVWAMICDIEAMQLAVV